MLKSGTPFPYLPSRKRLLIVGSFPGPSSKIHGGIAASCQLLLKSKLAENMEFVLLDSTQRTIPPPSLLMRTAYAIPRGLAFLKLFHIQKPDVVLLFASVGMGFFEKSIYAIYARLFDVPSMLFLRGGGLITSCRNSFSYRALVKVLLRAPRYLLCQAETWHLFFVNEMNVKAERCPIIKNWTATPDFLEIGQNRKYIQRSETVIFFMGWLDKQKGVQELIEAASRLKDVYPFMRLVLAGEGDCSTSAREFVNRQQLNSFIRFESWVDGDRKYALLSSADIFCLPSYAEGLPNAMVEAMAAGLPVVVTPVGVVPDVIEDGKNGLLVKVADTFDLEKKLSLLLSDVCLRKELGKRGHQTALADFSLDSASRKLYLYAMRAIEDKTRVD